MVLARSSTSICMTLASSAALKVLDEEGMTGPVKVGSTQQHDSLSSVVATAVVANSILFHSQSNTH
jgi:hypothetical protein